jgi:hypothetical protein
LTACCGSDAMEASRVVIDYLADVLNLVAPMLTFQTLGRSVNIAQGRKKTKICFAAFHCISWNRDAMFSYIYCLVPPVVLLKIGSVSVIKFWRQGFPAEFFGWQTVLNTYS